MDKKFISIQNLKEKQQFLQIGDQKLTPIEIEQIYKNIHQNEHSLELLDIAIKNNFGKIFPLNQQFDEGLFRKVTESSKDLDQMVLYTKQAEQCRQEYHKQLFNQLGFQSERLILEFRKQGNILEKLHLNQLNLDYQRPIVQLINRLCPKDLSFNPELFQLMLIPFKSIQRAEEKDIMLLDKLADVLKRQCNGEGQTNQNQVHDWLAILTGILQQSFEDQSLGLLILLKKITSDPIHELLLRHKNYMLFNYFSTSQGTIKIFQGLTKNAIIQETLIIINDISQLIYQYVLEKRSQLYFNILKDVYYKFILIDILGNIQMLQCQNEIMDLLLFYMVGMSSIENQLQENAINLLCERLQVLANLKFNTRDFIGPKLSFLQTLNFYYKNQLDKHEQFQRIFNYCQQKSSDIARVKTSFQPWQIINLPSQKKIDQNLYQRDSLDFVGLENLTNTCFMNSILQSLYMTQQFRQFILELKFTDQSLELIPHTSCLSSLQKLFMLLTYQNQGYCSPYELKRQLREPYSNTNDQQDVGEFVHHFLEDLLEIIPQNLQIVLEKMFFGYHRSIIECINCPKKQPHLGQKEKFLGMDLHFSIDEEDVEDLYDMIRKAYEKEEIEFTCEKCHKKSDNNQKYQQLIQLPSILFMTLHRFTYNLNSQSMNKMLTKVPFRFEIDMREIFKNKHLNSQDSIYYLYAFIVHLGKNSNSGHYICHARQLNQPDIWIAFDDTMITSQELTSQQLDEQLIAEEAPYLLFYQNKSGNPLIFNN